MNKGKKFEADIKKSIPKQVYFQRIYDQSFDHTSKLTRFTKKNPFDCMIFSKNTLYLLELKSTQQNFMSIQTKKTEKTKMIKLNQIEALFNATKYVGIVSGFVLNFRLDKNYCFFLDVKKLKDMLQLSNKKSINFQEVSINAIEIDSEKLKVTYKYNISKFIDNTCNSIPITLETI